MQRETQNMFSSYSENLEMAAAIDTHLSMSEHVIKVSFLFPCPLKTTSKLRVTGLCEGNSPVTGDPPHKWPLTRKMFPFDDVIMACLLFTASLAVIYLRFYDVHFTIRQIVTRPIMKRYQCIRDTFGYIFIIFVSFLYYFVFLAIDLFSSNMR